MILVDTRSTFLDTEGKPLSAGRLLFYKADNTTPLVGYADDDFSIPIGTSVRLMDAGWLEHEVFFTETAYVHVQKFVGVDEQNTDLFSDEKVLTVPPSVTTGGSSSGSYLEVDTIADLQEVIPSDGMLVFVKGYFSIGDAPIRAAYFDINSSATANNGTVIDTNQAPSGKWIIPIEGPYVDSRIFGVIPSGSLLVVNSNLASFVAYCTSAKKTAYFSTGNYYLTSGGSLTISCDIKAACNVKIQSPNGAYNLTVEGVIDAIDTFAGTNVTLILNGSKHNNQIYKDTIFNSIADCALGNSTYSLNVTSTVTINVTNSKTFKDLIIDESKVCTLSIPTGVTININAMSGSGKISWNAKAPVFKILYVSKVNNPNALVAYGLFESVTEKLIIDSILSTPSTGTFSCMVPIELQATLNVNSTLVVYKSLDGKDGTLNTTSYSTGKIQYSGSELPSSLFADGDLLISSFNASSSVLYLDMRGKSSAYLHITKSGYVKNGSVAGWVTPGGFINAENMTIWTRPTIKLTCSNLVLKYCIINASAYTTQSDSIATFDSSTMETVNLIGPSATLGCYLPCKNSVWNEVNKSSGLLEFYCKGGAARLTKCTADLLVCEPLNNILCNFHAEGCSFTGNGLQGGIFFKPFDIVDSTEKLAFNITITRTTLNGYNINSSTGYANQKWATQGHYNINIYDNELARSTKGYSTFTYTRTYANGGNYFGTGYLVPTLANGKDAIFLFDKRVDVVLNSVLYTSCLDYNTFIVNPNGKNLRTFYVSGSSPTQAFYIGTKTVKEGNDTSIYIPTTGTVCCTWNVYP